MGGNYKVLQKIYITNLCTQEWNCFWVYAMELLESVQEFYNILSDETNYCAIMIMPLYLQQREGSVIKYSLLNNVIKNIFRTVMKSEKRKEKPHK